MIRILLKWFEVDFPDIELMAIATVSKDNDFYGEWVVTMKDGTIIHRASDPAQRFLPPICERTDVMEEVENLAKTYYAGIHKLETIHKWVEDDGDFRKYLHFGR